MKEYKVISGGMGFLTNTINELVKQGFELIGPVMPEYSNGQIMGVATLVKGATVH